MTVKTGDTGTLGASASSSTWNWHPPLPLAGVPYWDWPPRPLAVVKWLVAYFVRPTDRLLCLLFGLVVGFWLQPVTEAQAVLSADWVLPVFLRNALAYAGNGQRQMLRAHRKRPRRPRSNGAQWPIGCASTLRSAQR